ncbi:MAG: response regulator transcription factor [Bacteroidales bacterium]|nr:response regulator transcription factor [Bacteroidales bacterium]
MNRVTQFLAISALVALAALAVSFRKPFARESAQQVRDALDHAETMVTLSQYEEAVSYGFEALHKAEEMSGEEARRLVCEAHTVLSRVYLQAIQDSLAWVHACEAEQMAVREHNDSLLATALFLKGQVCSYAGVSKETSRDDEAMDYTQRALAIAEKDGYDNIATSARYQLSEIFVNKNRWNVELDRDLYERAGYWLERAEESDPEAPSIRSMRYHFRYLRQGNRTEESIDYCNRMLDLAPEENHLLRQQMQDHLTNMYLQTGQYAKAAESHQAFSYEMQRFIRQKEDKVMQELQMMYEVELKDKQIRLRTGLVALLVVLLLVALAAVYMFIRLNRKISLQNRKIKHISKSRELLFAAIASDLKDPELESIQNEDVLAFVRRWPEMSEEEIARESAVLTEGEDALDPAVAKYVSELMLSRKKALSRVGLSDREREIIALSKEGLTDKQIAERLFLSPRTVSNHKQHIYGKLDVKSNSEMLKKAQELGL